MMVIDVDVLFEQFLIFYYFDYSIDYWIMVKELVVDCYVFFLVILRKLIYLINNDLIVLNIDFYDCWYCYLMLIVKGEKLVWVIEKVNEECFGKFFDEFGWI